jgi:membrane protease YdiL (CAAX protease family)
MAALARPAWQLPAAALAASALALGAALLVPRSFSDPVGVDPFQVRLAACSLLLFGAALVSARLAMARAVLLAVASVAAPFCLWAATPRILGRLVGGRLSYDQQVLIADGLYVVASLAFVLASRWVTPVAERPRIRLRHFGVAAAVATVAGIVGLGLVTFAIPAQLLGRIGLEPQVIAHNLPWLGPAYALQGAAQEIQFRGLLLGSLERAMPAWASNLGQASLFGLAHIAVQFEGPAGPFVPVTIALGLVLGWVTQRTGSLWPAIAVHGVLEVGAGFLIIAGLYGY